MASADTPKVPKRRGRKPGATKAQSVRLALHPTTTADLLWLRDTYGWGGNGDAGDVARFVLLKELARLQESGFIRRGR